MGKRSPLRRLVGPKMQDLARMRAFHQDDRETGKSAKLEVKRYWSRDALWSCRAEHQDCGCAVFLGDGC